MAFSIVGIHAMSPSQAPISTFRQHAVTNPASRSQFAVKEHDLRTVQARRRLIFLSKRRR